MDCLDGSDGLGEGESARGNMGGLGEGESAHGDEAFTWGGEVSSGFSSVERLFLAEFQRGGQEDRAQLCIYVRGRKVVDLWASRVASPVRRWGIVRRRWGCRESERPYGPDSLQNIFSSSKERTPQRATAHDLWPVALLGQPSQVLTSLV